MFYLQYAVNWRLISLKLVNAAACLGLRLNLKRPLPEFVVHYTEWRRHYVKGYVARIYREHREIWYQTQKNNSYLVGLIDFVYLAD